MYADRDRCCRHAQRLDSHAAAGEAAQAVRRVRQVGGKQLGRLRLKGTSTSSFVCFRHLLRLCLKCKIKTRQFYQMYELLAAYAGICSCTQLLHGLCPVKSPVTNSGAVVAPAGVQGAGVDAELRHQQAAGGGEELPQRHQERHGAQQLPASHHR